MASLQVSQLVSDIYKKAGNATRDQLSIELVLSYLYDELNKRIRQVNTSEQNGFLKQVDRPLTTDQEQPVSIEDFGTPVAVHLLNPFSTAVVPIEVVNFNALIHKGNDGQMTCAIYGSPPMIRFSMKLSEYSQWQVRFWYESNNETAKGFNALVDVNPQFRSMIVYNVVINLLPYLEAEETMKDRIENNLMRELMVWEDLWDREVNTSKQYGNNRRTPYRAGQMQRRHDRRY